MIRMQTAAKSFKVRAHHTRHNLDRVQLPRWYVRFFSCSAMVQLILAQGVLSVSEDNVDFTGAFWTSNDQSLHLFCMIITMGLRLSVHTIDILLMINYHIYSV